MSDPDFWSDDGTPMMVQPPALGTPSIMGGVDFSGNDLPISGQGQTIPWSVQSGAMTSAVPSFAGGSQYAPDRAKGIGTALDTADTIVDGVHSAIGQAAKTIGADAGILKGLDRVKTGLTLPLTIGSGIADTVSDMNHGVSPTSAIVGNAIRTGGIVVSGMAGGALGGPLGAADAGYLAGKLLPDGATIGNDVVGLFK